METTSEHAWLRRRMEGYALAIGYFGASIVIPRAAPLFEEPGALEEVARLAREWFTRYLVPDAGERRSA
jgi:hypothetical protein